MIVNITRENVAWASGFFDGEGHVVRYATANKKQYPMFGIGLDQNDPELLVRFTEVFGCGNVRARPGRKCHTLRYTNFEQAQAIAATIWPWLSAKRKQEIKETLVAVQMHKHRIGVEPGRDRFGRLSHKDECKNGHSYETFGIIDARGYWKCLECFRVRNSR